ncbi:MAG: beta-hydroxyacyl-ACP dehydratase [Phycisphaerales bacterium]|nr:beta-hydroxyacyl-ACP dehydratase [Phycisphaerales bacterium]
MPRTPGELKTPEKALFPLEGIDPDAVLMDRDEIGRWIPHRDVMALLDKVVWLSEEKDRAVASMAVRDDSFWVPGHFPGRPMMPGVIQIEAAAQLAAVLFNLRRGGPQLAAFLRISEAAFRNMVEPGRELILLCKEVKIGRRRFETDVQGIVDGAIAFEARLSGMSLGDVDIH